MSSELSTDPADVLSLIAPSDPGVDAQWDQPEVADSEAAYAAAGDPPADASPAAASAVGPAGGLDGVQPAEDPPVEKLSSQVAPSAPQQAGEGERMIAIAAAQKPLSKLHSGHLFDGRAGTIEELVAYTVRVSEEVAAVHRLFAADLSKAEEIRASLAQTAQQAQASVEALAALVEQLQAEQQKLAEVGRAAAIRTQRVLVGRSGDEESQKKSLLHYVQLHISATATECTKSAAAAIDEKSGQLTAQLDRVGKLVHVASKRMPFYDRLRLGLLQIFKPEEYERIALQRVANSQQVKKLSNAGRPE